MNIDDYMKLKEEKDRVVSEREDLLASCLFQDGIIKKAIYYVEELISDTKGMINNYNNEDKEQTIKRFIEDLETDIKHYEYLIKILNGGVNNELD